MTADRVFDEQPKESEVYSYESIRVRINTTVQNYSEGAIRVHYENHVHLQNEEHTKMHVVVVLPAKLHIEHANSLS